MNQFQLLKSRVTRIKQDKDSGSERNAPQVGKVDRRLKTAFTQYQQIEQHHRNELQGIIAREFLIVRPDASAAEVREAVEDTSNQQVFSQAVNHLPSPLRPAANRSSVAY